MVVKLAEKRYGSLWLCDRWSNGLTSHRKPVLILDGSIACIKRMQLGSISSILTCFLAFLEPTGSKVGQLSFSSVMICIGRPCSPSPRYA